MDKKHTEIFELKTQLKMGDSESNCEASSDSSKLLDKKDELLTLGSIRSGGTSRQYPESGPSKCTQNEPLKEERIEVGFNLDRILEKIVSGDEEVLSNLFTKPLDNTGNTFLHYAVATIRRNSDYLIGRLYMCIDQMMSCEQMNVNMPNKHGYTAIGLAVHNLNRKYIEHMLKHPSADRLYLDSYPGDSESTVREIIMQTYPDLQPLPAPLMERLDSKERDKKLLAALQDDKYNIFSETLHSNNPNLWYDEPYHSYLLEIACQMKNRKSFVELLLDNGADPNIKNRVTGMPLILATVRSGNFEVLEILLQRKNVDLCLKDNKDQTLLHWWARVIERNEVDKERLENCFKHLLQRGFGQKVGIDYKDISGMTPVCIAIECENRDRVILLLGNGADVMACEHARQILQSCSTSVLEDILDYCLESNDEPVNSKHLMVKLRYRSLNRMLFLSEVPHQRDILRYPVFSIFLNLAWKGTMKSIFFLNVALYVMFLIFLTAYISYCEYVDTPSHRSVANNTTGLLSHNDSHTRSGMKDTTWYITSQVLRYLLMMLLVLLCMREAFQLFLFRWKYIQSLENWLELLLIIVTFVSCSGIVDSIEANRHLFAIAILLGWFELVLLLGRHPLFSVQTEMFKTVSWTFLKFMASYIVLILAFACSFYILFKKGVEGDNDVLFTNPFISVVKTIVMFTGEFEASELPFDTLPGTSHVIFLLFVFFVAIILLNLLNGLAVGDTEDVRKIAETLSLVATARLISNSFGLFVFYRFVVYSILENRLTVPHFVTFSLDLTEEMFVLYPNRPNELGSTELRTLLLIITKKRKLSKNG